MFDKYTIKEGESLENIASKFNTDIETIKDINNIFNDDSIREDMEIIVPKNMESYFNIYTIESGDTLYEIARKYNINPTLLASINGLNMNDYIYPNQEILIPKSGYSYYITDEGDTLDTVSDTFMIDKDYLLKQNNIIYLLPGQVLVAKRK
jgi:LysM repeat protein